MCLPFNSPTDFLIHFSALLSLHPHPVSCLRVGFSLAGFTLSSAASGDPQLSPFPPIEPGVNLKNHWVSLENIGISISIQCLPTRGNTSSLHIVRKPTRKPSQGVTENLSILGSLVLAYGCTPCPPLILLSDIPCLQHQRKSFGPRDKPPLMFKRDVCVLFSEVSLL